MQQDLSGVFVSRVVSQRIVRVNIGGGSTKVMVVKNAAIVDKLVWVGSNYMQA